MLNKINIYFPALTNANEFRHQIGGMNEIPITTELGKKMTSLYHLPYGVFPLPDSDSYADSYSDSDSNDQYIIMFRTVSTEPIPIPIPNRIRHRSRAVGTHH